VIIPDHVLRSLPAPSLVVDVEAVDRNIARALALVARSEARLRPHFKAHKCSTLLLRQLAAGGCVGATTQTPWEALTLARAGVDDILVAAPVVDPHGLRELAEAARFARVGIVADSVEHVRLLAGVARDQNVRLWLLIDLDVGSGRCGVPFGSHRLLDIAAACEDAEGLELRGIQAYEGHAVLRDDPAVRNTLERQVAAQIDSERERLVRAGYPCDVVSGVGTGTARAAVEAGAHNELQIGSYVLMDTAYAAIDVEFEHAIACVARCVSRREPTAAVLNAGLKALASDHGAPRVWRDGATALGLSDEHLNISIRADDPLSIGDLVLILPAHLDPTVNLYEALYAWDARSAVLERWPVDARRRSPEIDGLTTATASAQQ
jgi:D-serine deaminase-like pyridoxal phosphate-dependent protein